MKTNIPIAPRSVRFCPHCADFRDLEEEICGNCGCGTAFVKDAYFENGGDMVVSYEATLTDNGRSIIVYNFDQFETSDLDKDPN